MSGTAALPHLNGDELLYQTRAKSSLPSGVSIFLFCSRNRKTVLINDGARQTPLTLMGSVYFRHVSTVLTEKIMQHAALFFPSF